MLTLLQYSSPNYYGDGPGAMFGVGGMLFGILIYLLCAYSLYKLYKQAGEENAWFAFIPILMFIPLIKIAKKPLWWILLTLIPLVNIVITVILYMRLSQAFGKSSAYAIGIILLPFIFLPMLAFGNPVYNPAAVPDETGSSF